ncbi:MAG: prepilin-type N-terminal cleavage/methylation domain-containing protein [Patescibacteria group bacterium]
MKKGFTLVELLVVVAIIGLMAGIATVSVNSVRSKARDARRVADIKQIQNALELYYSDSGTYPAAEVAKIGEGSGVAISNLGFTTAVGVGDSVYLNPVPKDPASTQSYVYPTPAAPTKDYIIEFVLETGTGTMEKGTYQATSGGMKIKPVVVVP